MNNKFKRLGNFIEDKILDAFVYGIDNVHITIEELRNLDPLNAISNVSTLDVKTSEEYDIIKRKDYTVYYKRGTTSLHRLDGPAIIWDDNSAEEYWVDGKKHRLDGPAVIYREGGKETFEWWVNGEQLSETKSDMLRNFYDDNANKLFK